MEIKQLAEKINGIASDSRLIAAGYMYVAIKGLKFNGENFIDDAVQRGAQHIVVQQGVALKEQPEVTYYYVEDTRKSLAELSQAFYSPQPANIVAVTGTNGKTSVAHFFMQLAHYSSQRSAAIGTLGISSFSKYQDAGATQSLTSPDTVSLNKALHNLLLQDCTHVAVEASSHGLVQRRLDYIKFRAGAFTNLSQDHLDYHGSMEAYYNAKRLLFAEVLEPGSVAVLNANQNNFQALSTLCKSRNLSIISYGEKDADIRIISRDQEALLLAFFGQRLSLQFKLAGDFQIYNALCALGLAIAVGLEPQRAAQNLAKLQQVPGRLERVVLTKNDNAIFIDYAHTEDALEKVLIELKKSCKGRLLLVFGCGGDRDQSKRSVMGKVASNLADLVIVTDDNPRSEDPAKIRAQIMSGLSNAIEIGSRSAAIKYGISSLQQGDFLLVSGKGHEEYQIIGNTMYPFSDRQIIIEHAHQNSPVERDQ